MKSKLDVRICDDVPTASNTQTYREYIRESENYFGCDNFDLDNMTDEQLEYHLDMLDEWWEK